MLCPELLVVKSERECSVLTPAERNWNSLLTKDLVPQRGQCMMIVNMMPIRLPEELAKRIHILLINDTSASG